MFNEFTFLAFLLISLRQYCGTAADSYAVRRQVLRGDVVAAAPTQKWNTAPVP